MPNDDKKWPRVKLGPITAEVLSESAIVAEAEDNPTFIVLCPVARHPQDDGGIPNSTQVPCSACEQLCWQAPSTKSLREKDTKGRIVAICLDCLMAMKRGQ